MASGGWASLSLSLSDYLWSLECAVCCCVSFANVPFISWDALPLLDRPANSYLPFETLFCKVTPLRLQLTPLNVLSRLLP